MLFVWDSKSRSSKMSVKIVFAFVSALAATSSTAALAQHVDPSPYSARLTSRSAPLDRDFVTEPTSLGSDQAPRVIDQRERLGYPLSPPNGAE
jgi:hypothetical protein